MSKGMESNPRTQSVIAKLMGLDELPPRQPECKPCRVLSQNYLQKSAFIGLVKKRRYHESHLFKGNNEKGQDRSGVPEIPAMDGQCTESMRVEQPKSSKIEVKSSFFYFCEELGSDRDIFNRQQPDSLFSNRHHDVQYGQPHSHSGHVKVIKPSNTSYSVISRKSERTAVRKNNLRSLQKLENVGQLLKSQFELKNQTSLSTSRIEKDDNSHSPSRIVVVMGKAQNAAMPSISSISMESSQPHHGKRVEFCTPKNVELHNQVGERKNLTHDVKPSRHSIQSNLTTDVSIKYKGNKTSTSEFEVLIPSCPGVFGLKNKDQSPYPPYAKQAKKQIAERWKATKRRREVGVAGRGTTLGQMLAMPSLQTWPQRLNYMLDVNGTDNQLSSNDEDQKLGSPLGTCCGENDLSGKSEENYKFPNASVSTVASLNMDSEVVALAQIENVSMCCGTPEEQLSEPADCNLFTKEEIFSHVLDAFVGQISKLHESSFKSHEEVLIASISHKLDAEFPSLGEGFSPSPNSVLEPLFSEEVLSGSEYFQGVGANLQDLRMQLQFLTSESEETNSEGPGMVVSSDEDIGDESADFCEENKQSGGLVRVEESRDFSYLVEVLDEADFHGKTYCAFESWYSPDFPINHSVFEILEKKYSNPTSWDKSERKLLFDCLNLGLKEILKPCMDVLTQEKPLRKRFNLSREVIEEELWMFLVSQRKKVSKDLSEKALGTEIRWFELREAVDFIVCEMERFLFDELAAELVSIGSF